MLRETVKKGGVGGSKSQLATLDIDKTQSHRWQRLAQIDADLISQFEATCGDAAEFTHAGLLRPHEKGAALAAYMESVGAKKQPGKRTDKAKSRTSDKMSEVPTVTEVAKALGIEEHNARRHLKAAEDYKAAAPEQRAKVDAGERLLEQDVLALDRGEHRVHNAARDDRPAPPTDQRRPRALRRDR